MITVRLGLPFLNKSVIAGGNSSCPIETHDLDGEPRIRHAQGPRQQQDLLSQTSSLSHRRGLPAFHRLQSARQHRVLIRTRRLILHGETYKPV